MENQTYSFRSSLHGFHRGDVIAFLEKLSAAHIAELRERDEALRVAHEDLEHVRRENALLLQNSPQNPEPEPGTVPEPCACERELEAYRRAERHEREARSRAQKLCADASGEVGRAQTQLEDQRGRLQAASEALSGDFAALQAAVAGIMDALGGAGGRLKQMQQSLAEKE